MNSNKIPQYEFGATVANQVFKSPYVSGNTYATQTKQGSDLTVESNKVTYEIKSLHLEISTPSSRKQVATVAINQQLRTLLSR